MQIRETKIPVKIRFCRWSRKRYAAFFSLGKCVSIGVISKSVTESALKKSKNISLVNNSQEFTDERDQKAETENNGKPQLDTININLNLSTLSPYYYKGYKSYCITDQRSAKDYMSNLLPAFFNF